MGGVETDSFVSIAAEVPGFSIKRRPCNHQDATILSILTAKATSQLAFAGFFNAFKW
jgi:hypothetical protein